MIAYRRLDEPASDQYRLFSQSLFTGEFALGLMERRPVLDVLAKRMGRSIGLPILALLPMASTGVPPGVLAVIWRLHAPGTWLLLAAYCVASMVRRPLAHRLGAVGT